jgi:hypothetical protein
VLLNRFKTSQGQCAISHGTWGHQGQETAALNNRTAERPCWYVPFICGLREQMTGTMKMNSKWRELRKCFTSKTLRAKGLVDSMVVSFGSFVAFLRGKKSLKLVHTGIIHLFIFSFKTCLNFTFFSIYF